MLPRPLCENLCSLNPGEDRLWYVLYFRSASFCGIRIPDTPDLTEKPDCPYGHLSVASLDLVDFPLMNFQKIQQYLSYRYQNGPIF